MAYRSKLTQPVHRLLEAVGDRYGISAEVVGIRCGYLSTTVTLQADSDTYVLKAYRAEEVDPRQLAFSESIGRDLRSSAVPIPEQIRAKDGSASIRIDGNVLLLSRFVSGEPFEPGNELQLRAAGGMLGRIHRAGRGVPAEDAYPPDRMWDATVDALKEGWDSVAPEGPAAETVGILRSRLGELERRVSAEELDGLPVSVIHGDYRAQNLLFSNNEVAAVLDLDTVRPAERLFDLAYALVFFQAVVSEGPLTPDERRAFLQAYDEEAALSRLEWGLLPVFLGLALLRGLTLWIQIAYLEGSNRAAAEWITSYMSLLGAAHDVGGPQGGSAG